MNREATTLRDSPAAVEYQVRDARITDVERISALVPARAEARPAAPGILAASDLLRQLVYLPNAVVLVADARRQVVGATVLALRPSVLEGGMVGSVDLLAVDPAYEAAGVTDSLIAEGLRSARNKGCVAVEATRPDDPAEQARWEGHGFAEAGPRIVCELAPAGVARS
ncbi:MAG TPA: GNAT family N-acetyltransferase [Candidatus Limnocylindrales bacterium]|nr:GNAT family N-acetyltransferase [Candidatus Limnocylindrales bacterium]